MQHRPPELAVTKNTKKSLNKIQAALPFLFLISSCTSSNPIDSSAFPNEQKKFQEFIINAHKDWRKVIDEKSGVTPQQREDAEKKISALMSRPGLSTITGWKCFVSISSSGLLTCTALESPVQIRYSLDWNSNSNNAWKNIPDKSIISFSGKLQLYGSYKEGYSSFMIRDAELAR